MPRRLTLLALLIAVGVLTWAVVNRTAHLRHVAALSTTIHVAWTGWIVSVVLAYAGLATIGWWAVRRETAARERTER